MNKEMRLLLEEEIRFQVENLRGLTPGTQEHIDATESIVKLYEAYEKEKSHKWRLISDFGKIGVYGLLFFAGLNFEKNGNFTSKMFQTLWSKMNFINISKKD